MKVVAGEGGFAEGVGAFVRSLGLEYYAYMAVKLPKGVACAPEDTLRTNYPEAWISRYLERGYRFYDPVVVSGAASRVPFRWGHGGFLSRYTKAQRLVFHEAREFDITEGYCVPVAGPEGDIGLFSVAAASRAELEDVVEESAPAIQLYVVQLFDEVMRGLVGGGQSGERPLSNRERECLLWTSEGLTTERVAQRVKLSESAVNYHLGNASRKLGAYNKHHAAIIALRERLL
ncbi:MAG: helix-turn-helix transcriptional regulator [Roseiarcus sp.]